MIPPQEKSEAVAIRIVVAVALTWPCLVPEMVENMKTVASEDRDLTVEERNLLSVAYKNVIGARRASWRIVSSIEQKEESKGSDKHVTIIREYRSKIELELEKVCEDVLEVLDQSLIPKAETGESKVFYHKMCVRRSTCSLFALCMTQTHRKGDYHRYLAEFAGGDGRKGSSDAAHESYKQATEIAQSDLAPTHPIRLGLALNCASLASALPSALLQRPHSQRLLLRDPQLAGSRLPPREAGL